MQELNSYNQKPSSGQAAKQLVVLLHGYGSNGRDLISLAPYWQSTLPDAVFVSPDAPFPCEMAPEMGYQWFSLANRDPKKMLAGVKTAEPILNAFIDEQLKKYNLDDSKLCLVGFSQGTMTSLYVGPRRANKIAGIQGFSGALIGGDKLGGDDVHKCPINLVHGEADSVVPVQAYYHAKEILEENGFDVTGHTTAGLEHSIDGAGVESATKLFEKIFS